MSIYIDNVPEELIFELPYSDGDGVRAKIVYIKSRPHITIYQEKDMFLISKEGDLNWLIDRLRDIQTIIKEELNTNKV